MDWQKVKADFEWDGSLRDIYVFNSNAADLQRVVEHLKSNHHSFFFFFDGEQRKQLPDVLEIFQMRSTHHCFISIKIDEISFNCHFFAESQIEFDIDPREIKDEGKLQTVLDFMREIGILLRKEVVLTLENWEEEVIFRFLPEIDSMSYMDLPS